MADDVISIKVIAESSSVDKTNKSVGNLSSTLLKTEKEINKVKKAFKVLDKAANAGHISMQKYSQLSDTLNTTEARLYSSLGKTTTAVNKQNVALKATKPAATKASSSLNQVATSSTNAAAAAARFAKQQRMAGKSTNKFGMVTQQVGYQVGDFFVQVQSGTDALVAFGQQGTQLAGLLPGLAGAVIGIGLSLGTALLRAGLQAKNLTIDFKAVKKAMGEALEPLRPMLDSISEGFSGLGRDVGKVFQAMADNFARIIAYATSFALILTTKVVAGFILSGKAATLMFAAIRRGLLLTGVGAVVVALGELILLVNDAYKKTGDLGKALIKVWHRVSNFIGQVGESIKLELRLLLISGKKMFVKLALNAFKAGFDMVDSMGMASAKITGVFVGLVRAVFVIWNTLPDEFSKVFDDIGERVVVFVQNITQKLVDGINAIYRSIGAPELPPSPFLEWIPENTGAARDLGEKIADAYKSGVQDALDEENYGVGDLGGPGGFTLIEIEMFKLYRMLEKLEGKFESTSAEGLRIKDLLMSLSLTMPSLDTSDFLTGDTGEGADKLAEEIRQIKLQQAEEKALIGLRDEKLLQMQFEYQLKAAMDEDYNKSHDAKIKAIAEELAAEQHRIDKLKEADQQQKDVADSIANSFGSALTSIVDGTKSVKDAFRSMARDIIAELYQIYVVKQITGMISGSIDGFLGGGRGTLLNPAPTSASITAGGLYESGGAFYGGNVIPFASGGVVSSPTNFGMSGGRTGLMGEAGPEAIMPLKRGKNGKLGVQAEGGSGDVVIHQNFNFQANGDDSVKKLIAQAAPQIAQMTKSSIISDRRRGGQMKATFG